MRGGSEEIMIQRLPSHDSAEEIANAKQEILSSPASRIAANATFIDKLHQMEFSSVDEAVNDWENKAKQLINSFCHSKNISQMEEIKALLPKWDFTDWKNTNWKEEESEKIRKKGEKRLSFSSFITLASTMDGSTPWNIEIDMQLSELISKIAFQLNINPFNLTIPQVISAFEWFKREYHYGEGVESSSSGSGRSSGRESSSPMKEKREERERERTLLFSPNKSSSSSSNMISLLFSLSIDRILARIAILQFTNLLFSYMLHYIPTKLPEELFYSEIHGNDCIYELSSSSSSSATGSSLASKLTSNSSLASLLHYGSDTPSSSSASTAGHTSSSSRSLSLLSLISSMEGNLLSNTHNNMINPRSFSSSSFEKAWCSPCFARKLRSLKRLLFSQTKLSYWESILITTTTPTTLPQDEYEDPKEIKTIKINRIKATPSRLLTTKSSLERIKLSVFGQLHKELRSAWSSAITASSKIVLFCLKFSFLSFFLLLSLSLSLSFACSSLSS
jgi:hypothetical protein